MTCWLMAPSPYLNQCWLISSNVPWYSSKGIIIKSEDTNESNKMENFIFKTVSRSSRGQWVNTLGPRQHRRRFADDIFKCVFFNENCCILIEISLKYARKVPIDNNPSLVKIMAGRRPGVKPLSEPMMCSLPTHICVTRPQWVNDRMCPSSPAYIIGRLEFVDCDTGTYFTDDFSIKIQIRWKFQFVQILIKWWLQNFAHDTTTILLHLQKMLRSDDQELNYIKTTLPSGLTYERKIISGMGLRIQVQIQVMGDNMILVDGVASWIERGWGRRERCEVDLVIM